jgi:DNA-binding transcriptional LysR family regulator
MLSMHQLRCFLATYEEGSLTAAAESLGYAQPSVSEQVRQLERTLGVALFRRVGRGVVPSEAAEVLRPYAERTLATAAAARRAVAAVASVETGTVRFGIFGTARLYLGAGLIADVLAQHPGVRVELVGQNSAAVREDLRRGRLEAAMIALPVADEGLTVRPVAREELVYVSADRDRISSPVTMRRLAEADLVLAETTWRTEDSSRVLLSQALQQIGRTLQTRIEVEDVETAVEIVGMGLADTVVPRGVVDELLPRLAPDAGWTSLRPRLYDTLAIVHRSDAVLSPAARLVTELAETRIRDLAEPVTVPATGPGQVSSTRGRSSASTIRYA